MSRPQTPITFVVTATDCHICTSHRSQTRGYPMIGRGGKMMSIVRWLYQEKNGRLQPGIILRHKCDNPSCINLAHIEEGTQQDNMRDKVERGRQARGESHGFAKLKESDVLAI